MQNFLPATAGADIFAQAQIVFVQLLPLVFVLLGLYVAFNLVTYFVNLLRDSLHDKDNDL